MLHQGSVWPHLQFNKLDGAICVVLSQSKFEPPGKIVQVGTGSKMSGMATSLLSGCFFLQPLNLLQVIRAVG